MKVCMVSYSFYETDNRVRRYAETLARRGDQVDVLALRLPKQKNFEIIKGVNIYRIQERVINEGGPYSYLKKLMFFFFRSLWRLSSSRRRDRYDVIHVHSVPDFEVFATIVPWLMGTRVILDIHDIVPEFYASKFKVKEGSLVFSLLLLIERLSTLYAHHVIIANHIWHRRITRRSVEESKCTAIINFPDQSIFSPACNPPARSGDDFVMCYPGTLNRHQGVDLVIDAMALLRERAPKLKFLIVGKGPDKEQLKLKVKELQLEDRVTFRELVPMEEIARIMASVDLGIVPKRRESFGNEAFSTKIMEFMAMGVPVLVSRTDIDQFYFNEELVQFVDAEDTTALAEAILRLMHDHDKRRNLQGSALEFIRKNNWEVNKHTYLDLVDGLSSHTRKRHGAARDAINA